MNLFALKPKDLDTKINSFQEWLQLKEVKNDKIVLCNKKIVILRVYPINFKLKSNLEQNAILNQYKLFLKNLNSKIQIIILSKKTDISYHLEELLQFTNENPKLKEMKDDYINLLNAVVQEKGAVTKEFYIVIEDNPNIENEIMKVKEYLSSCGNEVEKCTNEEIKEIIKNYVNKRICNLA